MMNTTNGFIIIAPTWREALTYRDLRWPRQADEILITSTLSSALHALRGRLPSLIVMVNIDECPDDLFDILQISYAVVEWDTTDRLMGIVR